jgi:hypothetical protein
MMTAAGGLLQPTTSLTLGGLAIGVFLLAWELWQWWRGGGSAPAAAPRGKGKGAPAAAPAGRSRDPKALVPFASGLMFGSLCVACPAGLLGTFSGVLRSLGNAGGGAVMEHATGQSPAVIAQGAAPALDSHGAFIVTVALLLVIVAWKKLSKVIKGKFRNGVWCGTLLAITTGVFAVIGQMAVPSANQLGATLVGAIVHGAAA